MKKTSVYLNNEELVALKRVAEREHRSQAEVVREAILQYARQSPDRDFALARNSEFAPRAAGAPRFIEEIPEAELMAGFGADSFGAEPAGKPPA